MAKVGTRAKGQFRSINPMHLHPDADDNDDSRIGGFGDILITTLRKDQEEGMRWKGRDVSH